jgi:hypothetical protein
VVSEKSAGAGASGGGKSGGKKHSVKSDRAAPKKRSVKPENRVVNTTFNTTDWGTSIEAKSTGKRVEIRFNRRKKSEHYFYWVWRWQEKDKDGNPVKRPSGTYVSRYEYGGKIDGATSSYVNQRIKEYQKGKAASA